MRKRTRIILVSGLVLLTLALLLWFVPLANCYRVGWGSQCTDLWFDGADGQQLMSKVFWDRLTH